MGKRKIRAKRSLGSLPKGIPHKNVKAESGNPFEFAGRQRAPKMLVHNRHNSNQKKLHQQLKGAASKEPPLKRRSQHLLRESLQRAKKSNVFVDRRIGEYNRHMTAEEQNLARLVKERTRRSKKSTKYNLNSDSSGGNYNEEGNLLTHRGKVIDDEMAAKDILMSDDDDDDRDGQLDALDTALHFGGMGGSGNSEDAAYGPGGGAGIGGMAQNYSQRKLELDDLIMRRKVLKAEKMKARNQQEDVIAELDGNFKELASMLQFRDKEVEIRKHIQDKRAGKLDKAAQEMEDWNKEIREYTFMGKRGKATDRTKTPEELAKEEAARLHELETRRLARMSGDFSDDDFSDVSDDEGRKRSKKRRKKTKVNSDNAEKLDDSDDEDDNDDGELKAKFTADGLVYVNKKGEIVKKVGGDDKSANSGNDDDEEENLADASDEDSEAGKDDSGEELKVGARVQGNYHAKEQSQDQDYWYDGCISKVNVEADGTVTYNVDYDDGDFEENMEPEYVRPVEKSADDKDAESNEKGEELTVKRKQQKAKEKARQEMPFVFEVPTTLEALHSMIGKYASTGEDASLIIQRIHAANSVKLDRRNAEKMQNFYDVLLRRFIAVGDAIYASGNGGPELGRYQQLDVITKVLFQMTQDSPDCAAAVWGRRFGILQSAHAKRLRDSEFELDTEDVDDDGDLSAWPTIGTLLLLRVVGHLFPVTDLRHTIVTPVMLLLGQMLSQTPVKSIYDLVVGTICAGLLVEYSKDAKRVFPEANGFLAGVIRLYAPDPEERTGPYYPVPTLESAASEPGLSDLRKLASNFKCSKSGDPKLSLEKKDITDRKQTSASLLAAALQFVAASTSNVSGALGLAERETFAAVTASLLCLRPSYKQMPLPRFLQINIASTAREVANACKLGEPRMPLMRRSMATVRDTALKSLAPHLEDPDRYSKSKDKGKDAVQVAADRTRREYKREHKAVARELRLDAAFIEEERRKESDAKTSTAREERNKNFAWLEGEQGAMNQEVRMGGGLLKGGGMGAAKAKAKTAKLGMKKGGKF